jgi:hypothetical protein
VMSAIVIRSVRYDENDSFELRADDLTAYGAWRDCRPAFVADTWSPKDWIEVGVREEPSNSAYEMRW